MTVCAHFAQIEGRKPICLIGRLPELDCYACPSYRPEGPRTREVWTAAQRHQFLAIRSNHDD